jgi:hypothetical protein
MKSLIAIFLTALVALASPAQAQTRVYTQAELDALVAPVALYPDALLSQVLMAATYPADVGEAAAFSRANPHLKGEEAVNAAHYQAWDPSVKSLLAFPDILQRMDESPQWMMDLGQAFLQHEAHVMDTVQSLRQRAYASGHLRSDENYAVQYGPPIAIVPARPHVVYVPYYDPYVVYGAWWWPHYRPVHWRPWRPAPVVVSATFFFGSFDWHRRHVRVVHRPRYVHHTHTHVVPGKWRHAPRAAAVARPLRSMPPAPHIQTPAQVHRPRQHEQRREEPRGIRQQRVEQRREVRQERRAEARQERKEDKRNQRREARHNHDRRG